MSTRSPDNQALGTVLVVGGCGFLGFHIIRLLLQDPDCGPIVAVSRHPNHNLHEHVTYRACDVTDSVALQSLLREIKPKVIIHTASPRVNDPMAKARHFHKTNTKGTEILLACAAEVSSVKAFVYTSTVNVVAGSPHVNVDEKQALWQPNSKTIPYWLSKAAAEKLVIAADNSNLPTVVLRLPVIYGERDTSFIPFQVAAVDNKQTTTQLGDNKNLFDNVYVGNAAAAHILAAKALLEPSRASGKVNGEAFNITDGAPIPFWDLARTIWRAAGDRTDPKKVTIIPAGLAMVMAHVTEWLFFVFTLGQKQPQALSTLVVNICTQEYSYNINKARQVLGYNPEVDLEGAVQRAVDWELQNRSGKVKEGT